MRASIGSGHFYHLIEDCGPLAIPARMAHRRSAFLLALRASGGSSRLGSSGFDLNCFCRSALSSRLKLFDSGSQFLDLLVIGRLLRPQAVNLPMQSVHPLRLLLGCKDERAQRRAAQVRTAFDVRTTKFVIGVEDELHRQPFLGKRSRCSEYTLLSGRAQ